MVKPALAATLTTAVDDTLTTAPVMVIKELRNTLTTPYTAIITAPQVVSYRIIRFSNLVQSDQFHSTDILTG